MSTFFKKILVFSLGSIFFLVIADWVITNGLKKERFGKIQNGKIDAQIVIIGTSRAYRHFDTKFIAQKTGKTVFNLGYDASGMETQITLLNYYLKYNKAPELLIWEIKHSFFSRDDTVYKYDELVPLLDDESISGFLKEKNLITNADLYIPFYRYRKFKNLVDKGLRNYFINEIKLDYKIQDLPWDGNDFETKYLNSDYRITKNISDEYMDRFWKEVEKLKKEDINVLMVFTPIYAGMTRKQDDKEEIIFYYDSLFSMIDLPFKDYTQNSISYDTLNFYNALHMNRTGVDKFMPVLLNDIKKVIQ